MGISTFLMMDENPNLSEEEMTKILDNVRSAQHPCRVYSEIDGAWWCEIV